MVRAGDPTGRPRRRVVLLGASNLTRGISTVIAAAQQAWGEPLEVCGAFGHGRSYGMTSSVLGRRLPGILSCAMWENLAARPLLPTAALLTDIGNDLFYGAPVEQIAGWVEACVERLAAYDARIILTALPLERAAEVTEWQFHVCRRIFFPFSRQTLSGVLHRAEELDRALAELATRRKIAKIPQKRSWYGWDPIHLRQRQWGAAWSEILAPWNPADAPLAPPRGSWRRWLYLRSRLPHERALLGWQQRRAQPSGRLADGTTIALY